MILVRMLGIPVKSDVMLVENPQKSHGSSVASCDNVVESAYGLQLKVFSEES